jgi:hypothetical protein
MRCIAIVFAIALLGSSAEAADWRYCLAQDEQDRRVYVTDAFEWSHGIDPLEKAFNEWLDGNELAHTWGICPLAISPSGPAEDVRAALAYNQGLGLRAVRVSFHP